MTQKTNPVNPYQLTAKITVIFAVPAILAAFGGRYIDEKLGTAPYGTFLLLGISYLIAWVVMIRVYRQIQKEIKKSKKKEDKENTDTK